MEVRLVVVEEARAVARGKIRGSCEVETDVERTFVLSFPFVRSTGRHHTRLVLT